MRNINKKNVFVAVIAFIVILGVAYKVALAPMMKSKQIDEKIQQAKEYIVQNEFEKSIDVLEQAQQLDIKDEQLLLKIIDISMSIDGESAYEFLERYVDAVGENNLSSHIKNLLSSAKESPKQVELNVLEGKYVSPMEIKINSDKINIGSSYYYTINGETPDKSCTKYMGNIYITKTTTLKLIGYNQDGKCTDVQTFKYSIDESIFDELNDNIKSSKKLISETKVGNAIGNISKENKNKLQYVIENAQKLINNKIIKYNEANDINEELIDAIKDFKDNIIRPVDKEKLKKYINKAEDLYNNSSEGKKTGQYKSGSKSKLKSSINDAKEIYDNESATQKEVDNQVSKLENAINIFRRSKIKQQSSVEQKILGKYIVFANDDSGLGITKFTRNRIISGYMASEGADATIFSRRESENTVYYSTSQGEVTVRLIDNNTVDFNGRIYNLINTNELIGIVYNRDKGMANYEYLSYFDVSESDINYFYSHH
ncbi:hypothetical protein Q604_UNBC18652G0002 [human gut metagenome]|uniref:Cell wall protein V n=2 Tax=root TaxID=1 RepID=R5X6H9_9FIRM|nr:chitobiase/beta-hexosaminidase C-terminal domain-containing protein [Intestinibacter bartlettii]CDA10405.1 cell wall protein V [Intestinibacter bartlettii CAG:1329]